MKNREPHLKSQYVPLCTKVAAGDTALKIARRYGVDYGRLMALNGITNPYNVKIGTEICIPPAAGTGAGSNCASYYVIREGDTLYGIARNFGIGLEEPHVRQQRHRPVQHACRNENLHSAAKAGPSEPERAETKPAKRSGRSAVRFLQTTSVRHTRRTASCSFPSILSGTNGGQQPGSSRPSRPGTSGNQQSGGMQIMPRTEVSAGTASSDTQSSAASASGSAQTQNVSVAPAAAAQTGTAQSSGAAAQASTGSAVMDALNTANRKDRDTKLFGAAFLSDSERTSPASRGGSHRNFLRTAEKKPENRCGKQPLPAHRKSRSRYRSGLRRDDSGKHDCRSRHFRPDLQEVPLRNHKSRQYDRFRTESRGFLVRPLSSPTPCLTVFSTA